MNEISRSHSSSTKISQVESERRWSFFFYTHFQKLLLRCSADAASLKLTFCQYLRDFVEQTKCIQTAGEKKSLENVDILRREKRNWSSFHFSYIFHNSIYLCIESERLHEMQFDSFLVRQKNREHSNLTTLFITTHSPIYARDRMIMRKISNFTRTANETTWTKHIKYIRHECLKLILIGTMMMMWNIVNAEGIGRISHVRWDHEMFHIIDSGLTGSRGCGTG